MFVFSRIYPGNASFIFDFAKVYIFGNYITSAGDINCILYSSYPSSSYTALVFNTNTETVIHDSGPQIFAELDKNLVNSFQSVHSSCHK